MPCGVPAAYTEAFALTTVFIVKVTKQGLGSSQQNLCLSDGSKWIVGPAWLGSHDAPKDCFTRGLCCISSQKKFLEGVRDGIVSRNIVLPAPPFLYFLSRFAKVPLFCLHTSQAHTQQQGFFLAFFPPLLFLFPNSNRSQRRGKLNFSERSGGKEGWSFVSSPPHVYVRGGGAGGLGASCALSYNGVRWRPGCRENRAFSHTSTRRWRLC